MRQLTKFVGTALLLTVCASLLSGQEQQETAVAIDAVDSRKLDSTSTHSSTPLQVPKKTPDGNGIGLFGRFLDDQRSTWASPAQIRFSDTTWLVPAGGLTAGLLVTDRNFSSHLSRDPKTMSHYDTLSNAGLAALIGGAGGLWLMGHASHNKHWKETGFLAGEASINSLVAVEALKYSLRRQRPFEGDASGAFFQDGTSFPSEHAAAAWAVAGVVAHEYPGPFTKVMAYGLASLVDYSRIRSRQHFPSDVFVGSIMGNLIAQNIYSRHHDPELGGAPWQSISQIFRSGGDSSPANQGSPYVPLDSWIYPALDRLAGRGLINSEFAGLRPWTRRECARLVGEGEERLQSRGDQNRETAQILATLAQEFRFELGEAGDSDNRVFRVESIYTRAESISGMPLNDGYHFAQTQVNDFGRPYGEGWSTLNGFSAYATEGRWFAYARAEWQTAPGMPALPLPVRQLIQKADFLPGVPPDAAKPSVSQFDLLEAYVGLTFSNWQVSFGRQSLLWGPGQGGPLIWSNNAAPLNMFRINRASPLPLPWILKWLGPMRVEFFLGQLRGQCFENNSNGITGNFLQPLSPQPYVHGEQLSFKPTPNFEFSVSRNDIFGGPTIPFTLGEFERALFDIGSSYVTGSRQDPGDEQSALNWSYRLPKLRNWLTFYGDAFADDELSPIAYFDRSAIHAGLYLSHVPGIPKLDLRAEGIYTDVPAGGDLSHGFFYFSTLILNGQTSNGYLWGSWIGREGQGAQAWTNFWFNARNRLQFNFRHQKVSQQFIPGGGTLTDVGARGDYWVRSNLSLSASLQYERWLFPIIQPNAQRNVTALVQIQFEPQKLFQRSSANGAESTSGNGGRP
jgi:membrane-associated phospholipid phosphatase